ncbi:phosphoribosylanthranilate isomerase [Rhodococcus maanshanensis]|uniref:N-(5'-phosphoribosyl)anthranilate isomerase n=1 Tax=Rhodococcus maanshanensis TaxID=183556 RepID=A0A1H7RG34_9NOCA|nr:phosphoribosylanthranilate isomerase [Rhodococcus maanshanensis]SEL59211.1 phosphoribosylanthranilate isomerase [Rhodococcus maanshanensis]
MTFIKMCGLRDEATVDRAVQLGVDAVGFVFARSPRQVTPEVAAQLRQRVPEGILAVGVFTGIGIADIVSAATTSGIDVVQVHDLRSADEVTALHDAGLRVVRAVNTGGVGDPSASFGEDLLLVDGAVAGAGVTWDWQDRSLLPGGRWILAGGLDPLNVAQALDASGAWGVDVSSGIESSRGVKDQELMAAFVTAVRRRG